MPGALADPQVHTSQAAPGSGPPGCIRQDVQAKFKFGGNVDAAHRLAVAERLAARDAPGDREARARPAYAARKLEEAQPSADP